MNPSETTQHIDFETGKVYYNGCFAAGTLVHTDQGPLPIERIRLGTRVLSQPEDGGRPDYRPVTDLISHLEEVVFAIQVTIPGESERTTIIATGNHPFWVENVLVHGKHWLAAECLEPGHVLQLADGRKASIHASGLIRSTQHASIGFAADDRAGVGIVLDLNDRYGIRPIDDERLPDFGSLKLGEPYLTTVYNLTVDEFHTYYVGEVAVWVHNANCPKDVALQRAVDAVTRKNACFVRATPVFIEGPDLKYYTCPIEGISVGDRVLSRCGNTGEMAYKRVLKVFQHLKADVLQLDFWSGPGDTTEPGTRLPIFVTAEHPIWIVGKGWTPAGNIVPGDQLLSFDRGPFYAERIRPFGSHSVYNFEVEDFHTYFVHREGIWVHNKNTSIDIGPINPFKVDDPVVAKQLPLEKSPFN